MILLLRDKSGIILPDGGKNLMNERVKEKTARVGRENDEIDIMWAKQELRFYEE